MEFTNALQVRLAAYLSNRYKVEITDAQAEEFLHCLADLYVAFADEGHGAAVPRALARGQTPVPDLITPHYSQVRNKYDL